MTSSRTDLTPYLSDINGKMYSFMENLCANGAVITNLPHQSVKDGKCMGEISRHYFSTDGNHIFAMIVQGTVSLP